MEFTVYTFGGGDILWHVFNGLALMLSNNSAYLTPVVKFSATLGGLWAAIRAIYGHNIGIFARDWFVPSFLILNLMLVPQARVHVIDPIDAGHRYSAIDHVPAGVALVASVSSTIGHTLVNLFEDTLTTSNRDDSLKYAKTGPLFAARLAALGRDLRIIDPVARQNIKTFTQRCYVLPFLLTHIPPGKKAAQESNNILHFISAHPHPALGMYWRESSGETTFLCCKDAVPRVIELMQTEIPLSIGRLGSALFDTQETQNQTTAQNQDIQEAASQRLKIHFNGAWELMAKESTNLHDYVGQQMMLNAVREGYDDKREEFGHPRLHPRLLSSTLVSLNATRGAEQQNMGFLISGAMAIQYLPSLQTVMFALCVLMALIITPMSLLPGGMGLLGMWVRLMIWIQSWPLFFAVLNFIGTLWLAQSTAQVMCGTGGKGLTMLTQNGLAEAAWDKYCLVQYLYILVPLIAWGVVSRSGHAIVSLAERLAPSVGRALGGAAVDNTLSFDTQQFHSRSQGMFSFAQQQMGPNFQTGTVVDDGKMMAHQAATGVRGIGLANTGMTLQEHLSALKTTVAQNDHMTASLSQHAERDRSTGQQFQKNMQQGESVLEHHNKTLSEALSKGKMQVHGQSTSESAQVAQEATESTNYSESTARNDMARDERSHGHKLVAGASASTPGSSVFGVSLNTSTERTSSASDVTTTEQGRKTEVSSGVLNKTSNLYQAIKEDRVSYSDDATRRTAEDFRTSFDQTKQYQESAQTHFARSERLRHAAQLSQTLGSSINTNLTDDVLSYVAHKRFSGDKMAAAHWQSTHVEAYTKDASDYLERRTQYMHDWIAGSHTPINEETFQEKVQEFQASVQNQVVEPDSLKKQQGVQTFQDKQESQDDVFAESHLNTQIAQNKKEILSVQDALSETREGLEKEHMKKKEDWLFKRSGKKFLTLDD